MRTATISIPVKNRVEAEAWFDLLGAIIYDTDPKLDNGYTSLVYEDENTGERYAQSLSNYDAGEPLEFQSDIPGEK